jgi:hypothetical protein
MVSSPITATVDEIYNMLKGNPSYSTNITKSGNEIIVYLDVGIKNIQIRKSKLISIRDYIRTQKPEFASITIYNQKGSGSSIGRVEIINPGQMRDIVIKVKPTPKVAMLQNWRLNEEIFADISTEYKRYAEEDQIKYKIILSDGKKNIIIDDVKTIKRVGGQNKKPDIEIIKTNGKKYKISIKMPQFRAWTGYANSSVNAKTAAKKVLDNLSNLTASFSGSSNGVSVQSTLSEVKEFCYGIGQDSVDYIINVNFTSNLRSLYELFKFNSQTATLTISVNKIYERTSSDYEEIRKNCYLYITKVRNPSSSISPDYKGYNIAFVPKNIIENTLPGKR